MRFGLKLVSEVVLISCFNRLFVVTNKYLMSDKVMSVKSRIW